MYASVQDLVHRMGEKAVIELTNPRIKGAQIDEVVAMAAIEDGQGLVDSYIGQRVSLPLKEVPRMIKTLTLDLAIYYLQVKVGSSQNQSPISTKLYDDAIKHLERFAKGQTSLGLEVMSESLQNSTSEKSNSAEISSQPRRCTRGTFSKLT